MAKDKQKTEPTITQAIPSKLALNPLGIAHLKVRKSPAAFYLRTTYYVFEKLLLVFMINFTVETKCRPLNSKLSLAIHTR